MLGRLMVSQQEQQQRVEALSQLKAKGYSYTKLVKAAMANWQVSQRQAKRYLAKVGEGERQLLALDSDDYWGATTNQLQQQYAQAVLEGKPELALRIKAEQRKTREHYLREKQHYGHAVVNKPSSHTLSPYNGPGKPRCPDPSAIEALLAALDETE